MAAASGGFIRKCELCGRNDFGPAGWAKHRPGGGRANICVKDERDNKYGIRPVIGAAAPLSPVAGLAPLPADDDLPTQLHLLCQSNRLFDRVPLAARHAVAESLTKSLADICSSNTTFNWGHLLTFPYRAFSKPDKPSNCKLATIRKRNLGRTGNFLAMSRKTTSVAAKGSDDKLRKAVEKKMQAGNISGAVKMLSSDESVAPCTAETYNALRKKDPQAPAGAVFPAEPQADSVTAEPIRPEEVREAILSFPNGSSGGLDGMSPEHLKNLVAESNGEMVCG
ncbi:hypothetical protein BV898_10324 [Hypsibius exemplaris]|uniref:Uncharacterized protein n=1 Tax=Hypsibius exemplaris TaxID=2072580 RepID=A0A1W0WJU6_HYPEX|nr:hypothetical protein BV898_10324 [Hypsibius exemplaris]